MEILWKNWEINIKHEYVSKPSSCVSVDYDSNKFDCGFWCSIISYTYTVGCYSWKYYQLCQNQKTAP